MTLTKSEVVKGLEELERSELLKDEYGQVFTQAIAKAEGR